jgi:DNA repair exonuclease SbcCD ATPase subunit
LIFKTTLLKTNKMKLTLENIRCYSGTHTFTFKDSGVTLLSGPSGIGKSTLLMAIDFVLFGRGQKLVTDGMTSCKVTFESSIGAGHVIITRSKRPNRLLVHLESGTLQDEEAQHWIVRVYGKRFDITGYIQQQSLRNFIYLSPQDKLAVLEDLIFQDHDPALLKKRIVEFTRDLQKQIARAEGKITILHSQCAEETLKPAIVDPPTGLETVQRQLSQAEEELRKSVEYRATQARIDELEVELQGLQSNTPDPCVWSLEELRQHDQQLRLQTNLKTRLCAVWPDQTREEIEELIQAYTDDIGVLKEYTRLSQQCQKLETMQQTLATYQAEYSQLESVCEAKFTCPKCDGHLVLKNGELHPSTDADLFDQANEKKKKMKVLAQTIKDLSQQISPLTGIRERLAAIEEQVDPSESIDELEKGLEWMKGYLNTNVRLEAQQLEIQQQLQGIKLLDLTPEEWKRGIAQHDRLREHTQRVGDVETRLKVLRQRLGTRPDMTEEKVKELRSLLDDLIAQKHAYTVYTYQRDAYEAYVGVCDELTSVRSELAKLEARNKAFQELRLLILKTEVDVLTNRLRELTALINVFLEEVFTDPIHVSLSMIKASKVVGEKVHISLDIFYKNMNCEFSQLSGGEQARVNVAFVLAFAHHFHSPLLLLDECTSNLDMVTTSLVVDHIQQSTTHKILLVAHDIVEGVCSEVVVLK